MSALTRKLILLLVVCITAIGAAAQTRTLSGEVVEKSGDPLVGVSVFNREYKIGTTTDIDGKFEITLPSGVKKLTFSYIGFQPLEIDLKPDENKITVTMTEDAQALDEVVVVGYGTQKKVNLTGAVSVITDKELSDRPSQSLTSMLQGTTPGLNITTGSGLPNKSPSINVRGTTSVNATNPLVLVDGVESDLSQVNPSDVKSISVIKDASAAAIYGARAAFGVILVTTKAGESDDATGKRARTTVRYSGRFGWEANTNSTDYEDRGYWAVYTANLFARAKDGKNIIDYTDKDMAELLARVNDRTEHPDRPWIVEDVRNGKKQWVYYGNYEFDKECITNRDRMFDCPQNLREEEMFEVPEWAANKVVYQIFPSRFAATEPVDKELWYKAPITPMDDLHGNLRGIIEHMDDIQNLGIDVLYMTPIFQSNSCHKYDTTDYYQIDPSFGTTEDLKELVQKAHERGMKVVLDAVYNHTGREFFAFADILENGEKSKYRDWYFIDGFPLKSEWGEIPNFKCFGYYGGMPKLNLKNPEVEKYITDVACYWIKECDIDGWRLDVGDEISHFFWKNFRKAVKAVKKDMLIIGEIWHYAGDFLEGDEWDTVMNYPFYLNLIDLLADEKITVSQFVQNLGYLKGRLHKKCYPLMWNLIDSHDTARFLHLCNDNKKKQHLAAAFQLLLPGMPMIYYGDEYAMPGANDPDCRRGMYWDEEYQDKEMYEWYKRLIQVRKSHACIVEGELAASVTEDEEGTIVLIRKNGEETIAMIFNCSSSAKKFNEYTQKYNLLTENTFDGNVEGFDAAVIML